MAKDPELRVHRDWLGLLQPVGLVVSPPALAKAQAVPSKNVIELQKRVLEVTSNGRVLDFPAFAMEIFGWEADDLVGHGGTEVPKHLEIALTEYHETLAPTYAVPQPRTNDEWLMLVQILDAGTKLDTPADLETHAWHASPQVRFERLLRETGVHTGLLCNGDEIRIVHAPPGESSGHLTFPVEAMCEVPGRPILAALHMLLSAERLFTLPTERRLPALLADSRKYQNEVSTKLSEQVLRALGELLRGFQAADDMVNGQLLGEAAHQDPQHIYGGLITTLLRMVFLLYAEERDLIPGRAVTKGDGATDEHALSVYREHYSVTGVFEKLRADAGLYPDTMDQRFGAWARLLSLFRLVFDGGAHGAMHLPARHGQLFNPDEYSFLEGRPYRVGRVLGERIEPPRVSDGTVYRVLEDLLMLDGERLSYRSLDVEQIGSVYEAVMGFEVKRAFGPSIALRPQHVVVNLKEVLAAKGSAREKKLEDEAGCKVPKGAAKAIKEAASIDELVAALGSRISPQTPVALPPGSLYLQPTEERRRSGSHYTPRSLTEPIVRTTLRPILEDLGDKPTPEQILDLKVCDPAMGSGAFLVETCRHLADKLVEAWAAHGATPEIPPDEDPILHARRLVAQRCLYGVDKNPFAVNLAKLSLWLVTLAKDHPFTFIDHALKHGDSLVGLTRKQIAAFHWKEDSDQDLPLFKWVAAQVGKAKSARRDIAALGDGYEAQKRTYWREAEDALEEARLTGDLVVSAFFAEEKEKAREEQRKNLWDKVQRWRRGDGNENELRGIVEEMRGAQRPVVPLHWEVEFPEVFDRGTPGFNCFVGNPPFAGKNTLASSSHPAYPTWLGVLHEHAHGNSDVVAHFFLRAYALLKEGGALGFIATNTVRQGDTRATGLRELRRLNGTIYSATTRLAWPGQAAVVVSVVHVAKRRNVACTLDGRPVDTITSYLVRRGTDEEPAPLASNRGLAFQGSIVLGMGFTFDDTDKKGVASPTETMRLILKRSPRSAKHIRPFIGYSEVANDPEHSYYRYAIDFGDLDESQAREHPELMAILQEKVRPEREKKRKKGGVAKRRADYWWQHGSPAKELYAAIRTQARVLVTASQAAVHYALAFLPYGYVYSSNLNVFALDTWASFAFMQSRVHEVWARFFGSTMKDDLSYTPTTCFSTFPFVREWTRHAVLEPLGEAYYAHRAQTMRAHQEGLTPTYNRFHDPHETSLEIIKLRDLHDQMDQAVLAAYGWDDMKPRCEFLLDYEDDDSDNSSNRKKPWRYRWPDELQEEVLSRLLDLNHQRAEEERQAGLAAEKKQPKKRGKKAGKKKGSRKQPTRGEPLHLVPERLHGKEAK